MRIKFLVTPVGLMNGNVVSAGRLKEALLDQGVDVTDNREERSYDLLHVHTPVPLSNALEVRRAKKKRVPVIIHAHTTAEDTKGTWTGSTMLSGWVGRYLNRFYNMADVVLSPSTWTREMLKARGLRAPVEVLSNGVDLERFVFDPERRRRFRETYGISKEKKLVYGIGVVCLKKGIEVLPDVAKQLPDVEFLWIGRGSRIYSPLKVRRAVHRCPANVRFIGYVPDIVDAHCAGDIFFTPSFAENQGVALMEAMAVGRPVVARDLPVYQGLLEDGRNALLGRNVEDFVKAIERLRTDDALGASLAQKGRAALPDHDMKKVVKRLVSIYDSLIERKSFQGEGAS